MLYADFSEGLRQSCTDVFVVPGPALSMDGLRGGLPATQRNLGP